MGALPAWWEVELKERRPAGFGVVLLCSGHVGSAWGDCARCVWTCAVRVECAGATNVVAERAKRNRPDAARREGSRAMLAALVIAYDMAAAQAFRSGVSRCR